MTDLLSVYRAQLKTTLVEQLQYRGALLIWFLGLLVQPVIYLAVWSTVARSRGGAVDGYTPSEFAAYFLAAMLVNHATFTWIMWEFEFRVRQGALSPLLLRPIHPIHRDIAVNLAFKLLTLAVAIPAAGVLGLAFHPSFRPPPGAVAAFVPALLLAIALRFAVEWTFALAAFWTTSVTALNRLYFAVFIFSGYVAPLDLLPAPARAVADVLPFRWMLAFPVELVIGRLSPADTLRGFAAQVAWLALAIVALQVVWQRGVRQYSAVGA